MASGQIEILQTRAASESSSATSSDPVSLPPRAKNLIGELVVSACHADITLSASIEHSVDKTNWYTYLSFTNLVGTTGTEVKFPSNAPVLPYVRAKTTYTGATSGKSASSVIKLMFESF